ncbi:MAG: GntR family transcriptional regulator [Bacteroidales bacterium]|jgi:DNA-binding transcriptional regulator YhcF (GntR family)|nr:GntR family transcriptional regulator [Bacteroidales bacterium]
MEFQSDKPIYLQIVDYVCEKIIHEEWTVDQRISSVRELSATIAVNPNTVMRSYEILERNGIIYNRRGIGFSVATGAKEKIRELIKDEFIENELPRVFKKMQMLEISIQEIEVEFKKYLKNDKK